VDVNLSELAVDDVCKMIKNSLQLKELDLSWNNLRAGQLYSVLKELSQNR